MLGRVGVRRTAERIGFVLYVLVGVFLVGRYFIGRPEAPVTLSAASASSSAAVSASPLTPSPSFSAVTATPSVAPSATRAPSPSATPDPVVVAPYQNGGKRYAALSVPVGYTLTSPIAGTVGVVVYQFLAGEVRVGSNIPAEPFYPYLTVTGGDRRLILRPGALTQDVQLLVKTGDVVAVGSPLFRIVGGGASSWRTFYDRSVTAQVIASATALPSGAEVDPALLFRR